MLLSRYMYMYMFTCPIHYDYLLCGLDHGKKKYCPISFMHQIGGVTIHCKWDQ